MEQLLVEVNLELGARVVPQPALQVGSVQTLEDGVVSRLEQHCRQLSAQVMVGVAQPLTRVALVPMGLDSLCCSIGV